jgi:hypothetical protein
VRFDDLPALARAYVDAIERLAGVPLTLVSVGPDRAQTIVSRSLRGLTCQDASRARRIRQKSAPRLAVARARWHPLATSVLPSFWLLWAR